MTEKEDRKITVSILTYNRAKSTITSIKSVIQDPHVKDVYILDDGSDAENWTVLGEFCEKEEKIKVLRNDTNMGYDYNFMKSALLLRDCLSELVMLGESDMLFSKGWGEAALKAFDSSPSTVCISPWIHPNHLKEETSKRFIKRCLEGVYKKQEDGSLLELKKPFGTCYTELPYAQKPIKVERFKMKFVHGSVNTMLFRKEFYKKLPLEEMKKIDGSITPGGYGQQDSWLSWTCFKYNNYDPKSIAILEPGLALNFGEIGMNSHNQLHNVSWDGSFWWRNKITSALMRMYYRMIFFFTVRLRNYVKKRL